MAEQTEAKIFTDGQFLIKRIETLGAEYAPPNPFAMPAALQATLDAALPVRSGLEQSDAVEIAKRHERAEMHKLLAPLCTDLTNYCKSAGWSAGDLNRLKTYSRELKGRPAKTREDDPATPDIDESRTGVSAAQTSYPSRTEHFANFVETLRADANFKPTEARFKLETLDALIAALRAIDTEIAALAATTGTKRTALDELLYTNADNFVDAANSAKTYLSSAFKTHDVYRSVKNMRFRKSKRFE